MQAWKGDSGMPLYSLCAGGEGIVYQTGQCILHDVVLLVCCRGGDRTADGTDEEAGGTLQDAAGEG